MNSDTELISEETIRKFLWLEGDLEYKLDPLQIHIHNTVVENYNMAKKICVLSSRQIGKSYWVMVFALAFLIRNPGKICRVIAPTREKCEEIVEDNLNIILMDVPHGLIARSTTKNRWNLFNRSSLRMGALERQYVDKNRGGNASLIIYEECGFVSGDDFNYGVKSVIGPQLLRSKGHEMFISSPSEQPDHPLHTEIMPACETIGTLFQYNVFQSPTITDSAIVEAANRSNTIVEIDFVRRARKHKDDVDKILEIAKEMGIHVSDDFKREYLALIIRPRSLMVVPVFHEKETVVAFEPASFWKKQIIIDWGGVRDKTACYVMAYNYTADLDMFIDELVYDPNTTTDEIISDLRKWDDMYPDTRDTRWADVPGQLFIDLNDSNKYNYPLNLPPKSDWLGGVNVMAARFATKKIRIHPRCKFLIASIKAGMLNKTRTDFERSEFLGHCDALAAAMYGIRCQNRDNPLESDADLPPHEQVFVRPQENSKSLESLGGKSFGQTGRKFGSFAK